MSYPDYNRTSGLNAANSLLIKKSDEELKELLNNEEKLAELMNVVHVELATLATEKEMLFASNKSIAEFNLSREADLTAGRERLFELSSQGEKLARSVEEKIASLKNHGNTLSLDTSLALLQTSAAESEEQSDLVAEKFLDGDVELDSFIDQFVVLRKLMHLRRVKADKMADLIKKIPTPVTNFFSPPSMGMGSVPYPTAINMPMPAQFGY